MRSVLPPYGLSGGGFRFDPGSLLLFCDDVNTRYKCFTTHPNTVLLETHNFDERSRFMHERDHLLRHLSTSLGLVRHALMSQLFSDALLLLDGLDIEVLLKFDGVLGGNTSPVFGAAETAGGNLDQLSKDSSSWEHIDRVLLRYLSRLELLRAFDGNLEIANPHLVDWGLALFETGSLVAFGVPNHPLSRYRRSWQGDVSPETHPHVGDASTKNPTISSTELFEAFGYKVELIYGLKCGRTLETSSDLGAEMKYTLCAQLFLGRLAGRVSSGRMPLEFDAILDAALWIPYTLKASPVKVRFY